jgi:hypothetical protein
MFRFPWWQKMSELSTDESEEFGWSHCTGSRDLETVNETLTPPWSSRLSTFPYQQQTSLLVDVVRERERAQQKDEFAQAV